MHFIRYLTVEFSNTEMLFIRKRKSNYRTFMLTNDIFFLGEVYRYFYLWSALDFEQGESNSLRQLIKKKVEIIIERFLNSSIQPIIQINLTNEIVQSIIEQSKFDNKLLPHLFTDAFLYLLTNVYLAWRNYLIYLAISYYKNIKTIPEIKRELPFTKDGKKDCMIKNQNTGKQRKLQFF